MTPENTYDHYVVLFDGVCNLCNSSVNFIIDRDQEGKFLFGPLQSEAVQEWLRNFGVIPGNKDSMVLVKKGKVYTESSAALEISKHLSGLWPVFAVFKLVPRFIRDAVYKWIARNRYRWFGKRDACRIPEPGIKERFLE